MEKTGTLDIKRVFVLAGAIIAFTIGSGFATGQEIMQYYASYGVGSIIVLLVFVACFLYYNLNFARVSSKGTFKRSNDVYRYFCGKYVGTFFDYYSTLFCYMSFFVMVGGASSTLNQQYGLPAWVGGSLLTALAVVTVIGGLEKVVDAIGLVGPVIVVLCIGIAVVTLVRDGSAVAAGLDALSNNGAGLTGVGAGNELMKASANEWLSGFSYAGFVLLWFASFISSLGMSNKRKNLDYGIVVGTAFVALAIVLVSFALISNINTAGTENGVFVWNAAIPNLILAAKIWKPFAAIFALVVFAGIYTTAVPLLMNPVNRFAKEGTTRYRLLTVGLGLLGLIVGLFVPFRVLVNVLYVLNGYLGAILLIFMVVTNVREVLAKRSTQGASAAAQAEAVEAAAEQFEEERFSFAGENEEYVSYEQKFAKSVTQSTLALSVAYRQLADLASRGLESSMEGRNLVLRSSDVKKWAVVEDEDSGAFKLRGEMSIPVMVDLCVDEGGNVAVKNIVLDGIVLEGDPAQAEIEAATGRQGLPEVVAE